MKHGNCLIWLNVHKNRRLISQTLISLLFCYSSILLCFYPDLHFSNSSVIPQIIWNCQQLYFLLFNTVIHIKLICLRNMTSDSFCLNCNETIKFRFLLFLKATTDIHRKLIQILPVIHFFHTINHRSSDNGSTSKIIMNLSVCTYKTWLHIKFCFQFCFFCPLACDISISFFYFVRYNFLTVQTQCIFFCPSRNS